MLLSGRRKDLQDNNNYINKYGYITHICPKCKNLYVANINLNVECKMLNEHEDEKMYVIETPDIKRKCSCGVYTIQIDNAIATIVKSFMDKGYKVLLTESCEGHVYIKENLSAQYDFPIIKISGNIKSLIPDEFNKDFSIKQRFEETYIIYRFTKWDDLSLETFNEFKSNMIKRMKELVKSLPDYSYSYKPCKDKSKEELSHENADIPKV